MIETAEEVIDELNVINNEMVQNLDKKMREIENLLKKSEEKLGQYTSSIQENNSSLQMNDVHRSSNHVYDRNKEKIAEDEKVIRNDGNKAPIIEMFKSGYSPAQIAKKLDKGIGEIQLILNLKKKQ
jgi:hypothetical protein